MKIERQAKILELIVKNEIGTQEELTARLEDAGFNATQATVSRDIREMKLTKIADSTGKLRYVAYKSTEEDMNEKYIRIFLDGFVSMDNAENILVIKTVSGMAMAVAAAMDHF
ncbi:transcriptional regulator, ArgR family [Butyrivibrio fibrisolvens 16/4]|nr:transcriptional regulator, ArgR family [Butyrivibrio fibrisolvens 16/4]